MERTIISIDEELCNGCGQCIPACPEGALQVIDGKARLVSDLLCDGLGACLGECPTGALTTERRECAPYDEREAIARVVRQGPNVVAAHLRHLADHGQHEYLAVARAFLQEQGLAPAGVPAQVAEQAAAAVATVVPAPEARLAASAQVERQPPRAGGHQAGGAAHPHGGCPGSRSLRFEPAPQASTPATGPTPSRLAHWPVQLHLINPAAPHYRGADLVLAADCVAYALGDFHERFLAGRGLAIACPKLDDGQDSYVGKLAALLAPGGARTVSVLVMEVPCCRGLLQLVLAAASQVAQPPPIELVTISLRGEVLERRWVGAGGGASA